MAFTKIATLDELPPGTLIEVLYKDEPFAVCNVGGQIRALSGVCPHAEARSARVRSKVR